MRVGPNIEVVISILGSRHLAPAFLALASLVPGLVAPAEGAPLVTPTTPGSLCRAAIGAAEQAGAIPPLLMMAIGRVESGRRDPFTGVPAPWPWTINADGQGTFFDTKAQAIAAVRVLQANGVQSIDVGCMQVNLMHHPRAFANLDQALDPTVNASYAAHFLNDLHTQTNDWPRAAALYHSATPGLAATYLTKVLAAWMEERRLAGGTLPRARAGFSAMPGAASPSDGGSLLGGVPATLAHGPSPIGRDLAAYRAAPVVFAARVSLVNRRN